MNHWSQLTLTRRGRAPLASKLATLVVGITN